MQNAWLEEAQTGIKTAWTNINNLRYADDITFMAGNEEELNIFWINVKLESDKAGLKLKILKTKIMTSCPITSWQIDEEILETMTDYFLGLQSHCRWYLQP